MPVADRFLVNTRPDQPLNADAADVPAGAPKSKVADFVTSQSFLSFTVAVGIVKGIWKGLQQPFGDRADSAWIPLGLAALFGTGQFLLALRNEDSQLKRWDEIALAFIVALTNTLVLWVAAFGVEGASDDIRGAAGDSPEQSPGSDRCPVTPAG
jgi:hypothetical protein